jgi:thiosulfate/3-mercaptopyruvate sulfurtransferase
MFCGLRIIEFTIDMKRRSFMKKYLLAGVACAVALMLAACVRVGTSPKGEEVPIEKAAMKLAADLKDGGYQLVNTDDLSKWMTAEKEMIIIDTMPEANYAKSHIKGALSSPFPKTEKELTPADKENIVKVAGDNKDKTLVVYCGFTACRRSHLGAKALIENGYKDVYRYPGGIVGWKENNLPTD